jgi:hypothetical protein
MEYTGVLMLKASTGEKVPVWTKNGILMSIGMAADGILYVWDEKEVEDIHGKRHAVCLGRSHAMKQ